MYIYICVYEYICICAHIHFCPDREVNKLPLMPGLLDNKVVVLLFMCVVFFFLNKVGELYQCPFPGCDIILGIILDIVILY